MRNNRLIVSGAEEFDNKAKINPYYDNGSVDVNRAVIDHENIVACFKEAGIDVIKVPAPKACQDGVYTANWALSYNGKAVMARLPEARKAEEKYAKEVLLSMGIECFEVPDNMLFSGQGDSLRCGSLLFAGSGYRSDADAQKWVAEKLGLTRIQLHAIPKMNEDGSLYVNPETKRNDSFFYDLDLALSVISDDTIAYCPEAFDEESRAILEKLDINKIIVDFDEAVKGFACNLVSTGETVIMSSRAPKLKEEFLKRGLKVLTPEVEELTRGGGFIRCVSLEI
jgi:N-dimethylarginine dimethylaminohydrolase